jgi:tRNA modification GTPase
MPLTHPTIFALSSGRPPAAIAVVRISGPRAGEALRALIGKIPPPRKATLARVRAASGEMIDEALALFFPAPHSETGEDIAELQLHGGKAVIAATLAALAGIEGLRPAEPGEFTRRAFENGKLDLTRVEGLADLIAADTEAQRRQAFFQLKGLLGDRAEAWRTRLIQAQALVEAGIDFSDEADVPQDLLAPALLAARQLIEEIDQTLSDGARGERLREGLVVAIAGPPNAGKSSILNRIARREAAIVSPFAGTTRDVIEVHLDLGGYPVTLLDTAGIRDSDDPVEIEGVRRARERAGEADLVLWVVDAAEKDDSVLDKLGAEFPKSEFNKPDKWVIWNKCDLAGPQRNELKNKNNNINSVSYLLSAKTGSGFSEFLQELGDYARDFLGNTEPALVTRARHRSALEETVTALRRAMAEGEGGREDILAEELRLAARALGRLTGRVDVEDILDVIFRDFCIGK